MNWQPEHDEQLRALWGEGKSCNAIAISLNCGFSKNAVIGRIHRLGLSGRDKVASGVGGAGVAKIQHTRAEKADQQKAARKAKADADRRQTQTIRKKVEISKERQKAKTTVAVALGHAEPVFTPSEFSVRESAAVHLGLSLMDLTDKTCRWPRGGEDGIPITFCGQPPAEGSSYCPHCRAISIQQRATPEQMAKIRVMLAAKKKTYGRVSLDNLMRDDAA